MSVFAFAHILDLAHLNGLTQSKSKTQSGVVLATVIFVFAVPLFVELGQFCLISKDCY